MAAKSKTTNKKASSNVLYIGMDLGTSRSAVVSSSGKRDWVHSYVGWPRDFVARKHLGKDVLFGEEALANRLSVHLSRPLEQGVIRDGTVRDEDAVRELVHYLIEAAAPGDSTEVYAAVGVPAEALRVNKMAIRDAVKEYADRLMVVSEPFAIAYGLGVLNNALVIDIGAGTMDFCIMHGTMPTEDDQRTLTVAGDYIDRHLLDVLSEKYPNARFSEPLIRQAKEQGAFVGNGKNRVKVKVPVDGVTTEIDITPEMQRVCASIVPVMTEAMMDLISEYEPDFQDEVKQNIYLAGGGSQIHGLDKALVDALKDYGTLNVKVIDDPLYAGAEGALALAQDMPDEYWEDM